MDFSLASTDDSFRLWAMLFLLGYLAWPVYLCIVCRLRDRDILRSARPYLEPSTGVTDWQQKAGRVDVSRLEKIGKNEDENSDYESVP